jgi:phage tail P2-like protein
VTINDVEIRRLLPGFMKADKAIQAINNVLEPEIQALAQRLPMLQTWDKLDTIGEDELDELAWEINVPWYKPDYPLVLKRELIKKSISVLDILGTPDALDIILADIFGEAEVEEWFEYGGEIHHFNIKVKNGGSLNALNYNRLLNIIDRVKRKSQWLDDMYTIYSTVATETVQSMARETIYVALTAI